MSKNKGLGIVLSVLLIAGTATLAYLSSGFTNWDTSTWFNKAEEKPTEEDSPIKLKLLSQRNNDDGTSVHVISYTIDPEAATNKMVNVSAKYEDGTSCDDVVTCSSKEGEITLVFKKDFAKKIVVTVQSISNPEVKTSITCDYEKRVKAVTLKTDDYILDPEHENVLTYGLADKKVFNIADFINVDYSAYTIDKNYTFKLSSDSYIDFNESLVIGHMGYEAAATFAPQYYQRLGEVEDHGYECDIKIMKKGGVFCNLLLNKILNNSSMPTAEELYNLKTSSGDEIENWKTYLFDEKVNVWEYKLYGKVEVYSNNAKLNQVLTLPESGVCFNYSFTNLDFSKYEVLPNNITPEVNNLVV